MSPDKATAQPARPIANLGVQLFTLAAMASRDFDAALKLIAESGYTEVEFFGPYPFSAPETIASCSVTRCSCRSTRPPRITCIIRLTDSSR